MVKDDIIILGVEDCADDTPGNSIVSFEIKDAGFASFIFSKQYITDFENDTAKQEILDFIEYNNGVHSYPLWSELSETLMELILDSEFDMKFVEYDDEGWNKQRAEEIISESGKWHSLDGVIGYGNDCFINIFMNAMCCVNWYGNDIIKKKKIYGGSEHAQICSLA